MKLIIKLGFPIFVLLACVVRNNICGEIEEMIAALHSECVRQTGVNEDLIKQANSPGELPNDANLKCYMKCLVSEIGVMDDDGVLDADAMGDMVPEDQKSYMVPMLQKCKNEDGADACDKAFNINACFKKTLPDKYVLY